MRNQQSVNLLYLDAALGTLKMQGEKTAEGRRVMIMKGIERLLRMGGSLVGCRRVVHEVDTLRDVPFKTLLGRLKQLLLVFAELSEDIVRLLGSRWLINSQ